MVARKHDARTNFNDVFQLVDDALAAALVCTHSDSTLILCTSITFVLFQVETLLYGSRGRLLTLSHWIKYCQQEYNWFYSVSACTFWSENEVVPE